MNVECKKCKRRVNLMRQGDGNNYCPYCHAQYLSKKNNLNVKTIEL